MNQATATPTLFNDAALKAHIEAVCREILAARQETPEGIRLEKRMAVADLSITSGVSAATIWRYEAGRVNRLQPATIHKIALGLGVPYERMAHACAAIRIKR